MAETRFERLLADTIGLATESIGSSAIARAVAERQRASGLADAQAYWAHVSMSPSERQALVEAVVVPETWFFRDGEAFADLARVTQNWLRGTGNARIRALSVPCSTGEEPYSMAMTLLDAGVQPRQFQIDAVDISERALDRATRGIYGRSAFRASDLRFRDRYFKASAAGHVIDEAVRGLVRFVHGNLLTPAFFGKRTYDVIFCRNLLIYFDRETQRRAADVLAGLLAEGGVLYVTAAEAGALHGSRLVPAADAKAGVFRHASAAPSPPRQRPVRVPAPIPARPRPSTLPRTEVRATPVDWFDQARHLADLGRFAEAAACCEEQLRTHGPSARAFHLLGLVKDASGDRAGAVVCYRKALYLDPHHEESLVHLALLMDAENQPEADRLRARARRVVHAERG